MPTADYFFLIFLTTVVATRVFVYSTKVASPTVHHFRFHHYIYGVGLIFLGLGLKNVAVLAIGFGLFMDEVPFLIIHGRNHSDNYSAKSLIGVLVCIWLVYIFKGYF